MWDTWLYYHEGKHYLFYLHNSRADVRWDGMSVAVSTDGVHFDDHGPIIHKADDAVWMGTGMVWRVGEKFMLNFSEERADLQEIFFAESDDLLHWQRLAGRGIHLPGGIRAGTRTTRHSPARVGTAYGRCRARKARATSDS